ncbi:unnamed protein product [Urochloa humidicola]
MKGIFWNCRGLRDLAKHSFLHDTTQQNQLDFIALSETNRKDFSTTWLENFSAGADFLWHWRSPRGMSGGLLVGVRHSTFVIDRVEEGDYHIRVFLTNRIDGFRWVLVSVYGAAQEEQKESFLSELVRACTSCDGLPIMVGGDFNIIRNPSEKNNSRYNDKWPMLFNAIIETLNLREIHMSGRKYTWANYAEVPTYERLDRVLVSTEWELKFPLASVCALTRELSDHTPLLVSLGEPAHRGNSRLFKFELGWLTKDGFYEMVKEVWESETKGHTPMERWQNKIRRVRRYLRGWARNIVSQDRKKKYELLNTIDALDIQAETRLLLPHEIELRNHLKGQLTKLLREEEIYWLQRSKATKLLQGDANTKYFQLVANGRHRKTRIVQLEQEEGVIVGDANLKSYITEYYKQLFGPHESNSFTMDETMRDDIPQVSREENEVLMAPFSEIEIRTAIFQMEHNKAPGPDGFPAEFYQFFWEVIRSDLLALFHEFHEGRLPIHSLNFGVITLLPKREEAIKIQQYRPICLLNVGFKIFTKVINNRILVLADKLISRTQTAFIPGRDIMEGVVVLHETIHEMHRRNRDGVILKLDFEKAYDKLKWPFVQQVLRMKGFSSTWCGWIQKIMTRGSVAIKVNDDIGHYFQTKKGVRQGDPLSPILFNIVVDMLAVLINRAKREDQVRGVIPHLVDEGLSILQYADDTIIFMDNDLEGAQNMKLLLSAFEQLSGLKINFRKSEMFCYGAAKELELEYSQIFGCDIGTLPFRYLGIPMHHRRLRNSDWRHVEERFQKRLSCWRSKLLSVGGRLILINSVLSSLPMFMLSIFEIPRGVLKKLDYYRSRFFWQSEEHKKKYRLTKWSVICTPKDQGGLGVLNLNVQNKCLLSKWLCKLINGDGVWHNLLRRKYLRDRTITQVQHMPGDSQFWTGLMKVRDEFLNLGKFSLGDGSQIRFWEDTWITSLPLKVLYPSLYSIVRKRSATVQSVLFTTPLNVAFRRSLTGNNLQAWHQIVAMVMNVQLSHHQRDRFIWGLHQNGKFSVHSMYRALVATQVLSPNTVIWKLKIPLKIKVFMWYLIKGVILTKDNLARKQWHGNLSCSFCAQNETIQHLFFDCHLAKFIWRIVQVCFNLSPPTSVDYMFNGWLSGINRKLKSQILAGASAMCWAIWISRNDVVFDKGLVPSYLQVLFRGTYWTRFWSLLQKVDDRPAASMGCRMLESAAMEVFAAHGWRFRNRITF